MGKDDNYDENKTRLNKFISHNSRFSRREADELIKAGKVSIDGKVIGDLATKVSHKTIVKVNGRTVKVDYSRASTVIIYNKLKGEIYNIETSEGITLVDIRIDDDEFCSLIINSESTDEYIIVGNKVDMLFKETEISVKSFRGAYNKKRQNKIITKLESINKGVILSELKFSYKSSIISAIILTRLLDELALKIGEKSILILRTQEILLSKA